MKLKLIRVLTQSALFSLAVSLCFSASSQEKQKPAQPEQQSQEADPKKKNAEQEGKIPAKELEAETLRIETALAVFDVLVMTPDGKVVSGLKKEDFEIFEEGQPQQLGTFALGDGSTVPRSIILIMDYSASQLPYINDSVDAAQVLVDQLKPNDQMAVVTDDVNVLVPLTQDKEMLKNGLESLKRSVAAGWRGRSMQMTALLVTLQNLKFTEGRLFIVLQTDGDEVGKLKGIYDEKKVPKFDRRMFGLEDIHFQLEKEQATIYTIIPGLRLLKLTKEEQLKNLEVILRQEWEAGNQATWGKQGRWRPGSSEKLSSKESEKVLAERLQQHKALLTISTLSGGWTSYLETPSLAAEIYARIFAGIEQRYILGYYPANAAIDGKRRNVEIKVRTHPEYRIVGRKAYYNLERRKPK